MAKYVLIPKSEFNPLEQNEQKLIGLYDSLFQKYNNQTLLPVSKQQIKIDEGSNRYFLFEESSENFEDIIKSLGLARNKQHQKNYYLRNFDIEFDGRIKHYGQYEFQVGINETKGLFARVVRQRKQQEKEINKIHLVHFYSFQQDQSYNKNLNQQNKEEEQQEEEKPRKLLKQDIQLNQQHSDNNCSQNLMMKSQNNTNQQSNNQGIEVEKLKQQVSDLKKSLEKAKKRLNQSVQLSKHICQLYQLLSPNKNISSIINISLNILEEEIQNEQNQ